MHLSRCWIPLLLLVPAAIVVAADAPRATVLQGGVARWSGMDARECGIYGKRYAAVDATCYYPVDIRTRAGVHEIALYDAAGTRHLGALEVEPRDCTETAIALEKREYIEVSEQDRARAAEERPKVEAAVRGLAGVHPRFTLPLQAPAQGAGTRDRSDFCEKRLYNDSIRSVHTGLDYPVGIGTAVTSPADGTVTLADEHFYAGRTVMVDHGGGLVTMVFHLSDIAVAEGEQVSRGQRLGAVGDSGRTTGPHLHFGARWQGQRIDAAALLGDPARLPGVGEAAVAPDTRAVEDEAKGTTREDRAAEE